MKKGDKVGSILWSVHNYFVNFLFIAFLITCCVMLFGTVLSDSLGIELTKKNTSLAAKLTMGNVLLLSLIFTIIDIIRQKFMVDRPVKRIMDAVKKIMGGDFSARVLLGRNWNTKGGFHEIAECINKMAEELSSVETLRTDFIANVSHELKTPLAVMQSYSTILQSFDLTEDKRIEYAKAISDASQRLADLISNILKLNKLENQHIRPPMQVFNLGEQLCECLLSFENTWETKNIEIETDIEEDVSVENNAELLTLVWNNLFSNAMKFTELGGRVSLRLKAVGEFAIVEVEDTGCGIPPDVGDRNVLHDGLG